MPTSKTIPRGTNSGGPKLENQFITVGECSACASNALLIDVLITMLMGVLRHAGRLNPYAAGAFALLHWFSAEKVISKLLGATVNNACIVAAVERHSHKDIRRTVGTNPATGRPVRKRFPGGDIVLWGGGKYGGAGAGADWGISGLYEPVTGLEIPPFDPAQAGNWKAGPRVDRTNETVTGTSLTYHQPSPSNGYSWWFPNTEQARTRSGSDMEKSHVGILS